MESAGKGSSDVLFTLIKVGAILIIVDAAIRLVLVALFGSIAFSAKRAIPTAVASDISSKVMPIAARNIAILNTCPHNFNK